LIKELESLADDASVARSFTDLDQRTALGQALEARVQDISRTVLETWHQRAPEAAGAADLRVQNDVLRTTEVSTRLVSNYLLHGKAQSEDQAQSIAATGKAPLRDTIALSDLTKLYLYWRDTTIATITSEAARLGIADDIRDRAVAVVRGGSDGSIVRMAKQFDSERSRLERELAIERKRLAHQAFHDALTGLPNRRLFFDRLTHALDLLERHKIGLALIFIDLDDFKSINDSYGHSFGDEVLGKVARKLTAALRTTDTIARLGGDEFVVLSEQLKEPERDALSLARRICRRLAAPCGEDELRLSASIGIAIAETATSPDALIRLADDAMYTAKRRGLGHVHVACSTGQ
jgi:diguanylate cyclase (GGDEF)-like protein